MNRGKRVIALEFRRYMYITPFSEKENFFSENNYYDKRLIAKSVVTCDVGKVKSCLNKNVFFFLLLIQFKGFAYSDTCLIVKILCEIIEQ